MAKAAGRTYLVKKNGTILGAIRQKSMNWSAELVDTTTDDDGGDTTYLADVLVGKAMSVQVSGLSDDDTLIDLALTTTDSDKFIDDITLERPNGDVIAGTFILNGYAETAAYNDAVQFEATLTRSGAHTFTPSA